MKLNDLIKDGQVTMFSLSYCPYCKKAKNLLNTKKIPFQAFEVDNNEISNDLKNELQKTTNQKTFPSIFFGLQFIGGSDDLANLNKNGKIEESLAKNNIKC